MMQRLPSRRHAGIRNRAQRGMALVEALVAVLILGIGLIGTLGLQARSHAALSEAGMRAEATIAVNELIGIMATDIDNLEAYEVAAGATPGARLADWHAALGTHLPNPVVSIDVEPAAGTERTAVTIQITWRRSEAVQMNRHRIVSYLARSA